MSIAGTSISLRPTAGSPEYQMTDLQTATDQATSIGEHTATHEGGFGKDEGLLTFLLLTDPCGRHRLLDDHDISCR